MTEHHPKGCGVVREEVEIHSTAIVSPQATIGEGTRIWADVQVRERVSIGRNCIVGHACYIDAGVTVGDNVKIENAANVFAGVTLEDGVFIGPQVCLTNDKVPRAITSSGRLKTTDDWQIRPTLVRHGAALGAGSVVLPGLTVGRWAMVAAGAVVTRSVPDHGLVVGNPARLIGYVCACGQRLQLASVGPVICCHCGAEVEIPSPGRMSHERA